MKRNAQAIAVDDIDSAGDTPGAFAIAAGDKGLFYICPCGCKQEGYLPFESAQGDSWSWDGNREKPTLSPSIHHQIRRNGKTETHWHGYLRAGVFEEC